MLISLAIARLVVTSSMFPIYHLCWFLRPVSSCCLRVFVAASFSVTLKKGKTLLRYVWHKNLSNSKVVSFIIFFVFYLFFCVGYALRMGHIQQRSHFHQLGKGKSWFPPGVPAASHPPLPLHGVPNQPRTDGGGSILLDWIPPSSDLCAQPICHRW